MIYIGEYDELSPGRGYPSLKGCCATGTYPGQGRIIYYLKHGKKDMVSMKIPKDVFTGEVIPMEQIGMNDGEYTWFNTLAYYVEKYNLRLPPNFEDKILSA